MGAPDPGDRLVGRERDLDVLTRLLDSSGPGIDRSALLVLTGEPGIGKTALLDVVSEIAAARGCLVLRAAGVQSEIDPGFAGLTELLAPVVHQVDHLDGSHRDALLAAMGLGGGTPTASSRVAPAAVSLLTRLSIRRPVVLVVDDVQWLDRATADLLGLVARGLDHDPAGGRVRILVARRIGTHTLLDPHGHAGHDLEPLAEPAALRLVRSRYPDIAGRVLTRVVAESRGNPLALLELPAAMSTPQQQAHEPLPAHLPLTQRLQRIFGSRVLQLPEETRELLLVAALGQDDVVLPFPDWSHRERALAPAHELGLVRLEGGQGQVGFRHPLVRATVVELSTSAERRRAHQVLAAAYQAGDDRAAWHLAAATATPDEEVAELLERAAQRAWRRGDAVGAVRTLVHAAEMSPPGRARARRFAAAAYQGADVVGDLDGASRLMRNAEATEIGTPQSLQAATVTAYLLLNGSGDTRTAHRVLVEALQATVEVSDAEEQMLVEAVHNLCEISLYADDPELWSAFRSALARAPLARYPVLDLWVGLVVDPVRTGAAVLSDLEAALDSLATETDPVKVERVATAAIFVDRVTRARGPLLRLADDARAGGTVTSGIMALMLLSLEAFQDGDWDSARSWGVEGLAWCRQHGFDLLSWPLQLTQALLAAGRGDSAGVQSLTDRMRSWATPRQVGAVLQYAAHATALDALGRGDHETAFRAVSAISAPGELRAHCGHALWVPLLLVEAAVHAGHAEAARAHVAAMEAAGVGELSPRLALRVNGARAIAAPQLDRQLFDRALRTPQARASPFELARIQLRYGQRLRRARAATEARSHLQDALVTFGRLGAAPWVAATEEELRATGPVKDLSRPGTTPAGLTPQEHRVANLAAAGLSNRQIGERLLISARTVGAHLQGAFGKLAVHNRAGLTDALSQHQDGADPALSRPDVGAGSGGQA